MMQPDNFHLIVIQCCCNPFKLTEVIFFFFSPQAFLLLSTFVFALCTFRAYFQFSLADTEFVQGQFVYLSNTINTGILAQ